MVYTHYKVQIAQLLGGLCTYQSIPPPILANKLKGLWGGFGKLICPCFEAFDGTPVWGYVGQYIDRCVTLIQGA